jgi:hypothetical protein
MQLTEGNLTFTFDDDVWQVEKYDDWQFYKNQFQSCCCGNKGVDFLAYNKVKHTLWLIEVKDYRQFPRTKDSSLWEEVALKVRDTLAGIYVANVSHQQYPNEQSFAKLVTTKTVRFRVVLHLEQPKQKSKLFPRVYDPADVQQKLKQRLKPIDAHPKVMETGTQQPELWHVGKSIQHPQDKKTK